MVGRGSEVGVPVVFRFLEVVESLLVPPAGVTLGLPVVIVLPVAPEGDDKIMSVSFN